MTRSLWGLLGVGILLAGIALSFPDEQVYIALLFVAVARLGTEVSKLGGGSPPEAWASAWLEAFRNAMKG